MDSPALFQSDWNLDNQLNAFLKRVSLKFGLFRISKSIRWLTVFVTALAWTLATNHCTIGMVLAMQNQSAEVCGSCSRDQPNQGDKSNSRSESSNLTCCKIFRSLTATDGPLMKAPAEVALIDYPIVLDLLVLAQSGSELQHTANAPPGAHQFSILDLESCHSGLAPPRLA